MNNLKRNTFFLTIVCLLILSLHAEHIIILHTNDTHSQLDTLPDGSGGILRRQVLIDSIRNSEPNVILVDAGDVVQGSLYFSIYKGAVEREFMNSLGYEIMILGNHEFDNGMSKLTDEWHKLNAELVCTNYTLTTTPLDSLYKKYTIKEFGNIKVGFIGLNLDPKGMISPGVSRGVVYKDVISTANETATMLRDSLMVDYVVALTHIGYDSKSPVTPSDCDFAKKSRGIDLIIGGHSHTELTPDSADIRPIKFINAEGKIITVAQTGAQGRYLGRVDIDTDINEIKTSLLKIDNRYDSRIDSLLLDRLETYRQGIIDKVNEVLAISPVAIEKQSDLHKNWIGDIAYSLGRELNDNNPVDLAIINKGGLRNGLQAGSVTVGMIMTMLPFDNRMVILDIQGRDLIKAFEIMESRGGDAISEGLTRDKIIPDKIYRIATIDYLANGGDYMEPLTHGQLIKTDIRRMDDAVIGYLRKYSGRQLSLPIDNNRTRSTKTL